jgi:hypothetical protein
VYFFQLAVLPGRWTAQARTKFGGHLKLPQNSSV